MLCNKRRNGIIHFWSTEWYIDVKTNVWSADRSFLLVVLGSLSQILCTCIKDLEHIHVSLTRTFDVMWSALHKSAHSFIQIQLSANVWKSDHIMVHRKAQGTAMRTTHSLACTRTTSVPNFEFVLHFVSKVRHCLRSNV